MMSLAMATHLTLQASLHSLLSHSHTLYPNYTKPRMYKDQQPIWSGHLLFIAPLAKRPPSPSLISLQKLCLYFRQPKNPSMGFPCAMELTKNLWYKGDRD